MISNKITPRVLWSMQQINSFDVDYDFWNKRRESIQVFSQMNRSCIFTVDVFKERYDFASDDFSSIFGYDPVRIKAIRKHSDFLEERIHPDDRAQLITYQIEHGQYIYSLPPEERNDYRQIFQIRMLNAKNRYINVISRHQVIQKDNNGKAWIIMGVMEISPDQIISDKVKRTVVNRQTGEIITSPFVHDESNQLTGREKEILLLICQGLLSKEIARKLNVSIFTINNHRKNILSKLNVDNIIEAINKARSFGII